MDNKIEAVFSSSLKRSNDDLEELDNLLGILGERTAALFMDMILSTLDNPESTPLRIEIEYWPKSHPHDTVGPSTVYSVMGRGRRVSCCLTQEELDGVRKDTSFE